MALRRFAASGRRGTASTLVLLGLANPGRDYEGSRHNVGGDAVRLLCEQRNATLKVEPRQRCLSATIPTPRGPVTLAIPTTYMNESGLCVRALLERTSLDDLTRFVVVHDELDLEPGRLQFKFGGGLAGHNGLRSIKAALQTQDFARLRIGIGRPERKDAVTDWVLRRPTGERKLALQRDTEAAANALAALIDDDFEQAQRVINGQRG